MSGTQIRKCKEPLIESKSSSVSLQEIVKDQNVEELDSKDNKSKIKSNQERLEHKCEECQKKFSENLFWHWSHFPSS